MFARRLLHTEHGGLLVVFDFAGDCGEKLEHIVLYSLTLRTLRYRKGAKLANEAEAAKILEVNRNLDNSRRALSG